jgi:hypothetical protein
MYKEINRPWWRSNYNIAIKHWNGRSEEDECPGRDTGVQRSQINKYQYGDEVGR